MEKQENILDHNSERAETFYGDDSASYHVSKTNDGILKIKLDHSNKKFYGLSILTLIIGTIGITLFCLNEKHLHTMNFFSMFIIIFGLIFLGWLTLKIAFRIFQRVEWHFTGSELIIFSDVYFKKSIPRKEISGIYINKLTTSTWKDDYETKYWIILKVPETIYEEGALHLLVIQGINTAQLKSEGYGWGDLISHPADVFQLSNVIAEHWDLPYENQPDVTF